MKAIALWRLAAIGIGAAAAVVVLAMATAQLAAQSADPSGANAAGLEFDGGKRVIELAPGFKVDLYRVEVPSPALGWDIRISELITPNTTNPEFGLVVRRDQLPTGRYVASSLNETVWLSGHQEIALNDWTERPTSATGERENMRLQQWGMGNHLEPGVYFIAVTNISSGNLTGARYTIQSRGIGPGLSFPVREIPFNGGTVAINDLPAREVAYFAVQVPPGVPSWNLKLTTTSGDGLLMVLKDKIPSVRVQHNANASSARSSGKKIQKPGNEHYLLLPEAGRTSIIDGLYYVAVASEGQASPTNRSAIGPGVASFTLASLGPLPVVHLGTASSTEISRPDALEAGETKIYQFSVPPGAAGLEVALEERAGNPVMLLRDDGFVPDPGAILAPITLRDQYGVEAGDVPKYAGSSLIVVPSPTPGLHTLTIKSKTLVDQHGPYPDSAFRLRIRTIPVAAVDFDGGISAVTQQPVGGWSFFRVEVPADALAWDLRLTNVSSGLPRLVVRRDRPPGSLLTEPWSNPQAATNWPSGNQWAAGPDFTGRGFSPDGAVSEDGRILTVAMGQPLQAGTYYVGVHTSSGTNASSFQVVSRGVGALRSLPISAIPFANGSLTVTAQAARESAYYRVDIPTDTPSWSVELDPADTEVLLVINKDRPASIGGGKLMRKAGREHYVLLPPPAQAAIPAGAYYLTVVSEGSNLTNATRVGGGPARYTLRSLGPLPVTDLGAIDTAGILEPVSIDAGQVLAFQFTLPTNGLSHEILLEDRSGYPFATLRPGTAIPDPGVSAGAAGPDPYGHDGGQTAQLLAGDALITLPPSTNTVHTLAIKARARPAGNYQEASFILRIRPILPDPLPFEGVLTVADHAPGTWRYFNVAVPDNALGWDLRVTGVSAGQPLILAARNSVPIGNRTQPWSTPWSETNWPPGAQWAADLDWTGRPFAPDGVMRESGQILAMGLGRPLVAGNYFIGVLNNHASTNAAYRLQSRGIGPGFGIGVRDLAFQNGTATISDLAPREAAYFKVEIPEGASSWQLRLANTAGESALAILKNSLPNVGTLPSYEILGRLSAGRRIQKDGAEHFVLLPSTANTNLAGTYYLAVVGEGLNATNAQRIGAGPGTFTLESRGPVATLNLGAVTETGVTQPDSIDAGEIKVYQFTVPPSVPSLELQLEDRAGNPVMALLSGDRFPNPIEGVGSVVPESYGAEGGFRSEYVGAPFITVPNPAPGSFTVAVSARRANNAFTNASYVLRVRQVGAATLAFDGGQLSVTNHLPATWLFYRVEVPAQAAGWDLRLQSVTSGKPRLVISRETLPNGVRTFPWTSPGDKTTWPTTNQWAPVADWTRRPSSPDGAIVEDGRIFAAGLGRPLEPGAYFVGVYNESAAAAAEYRIASRGMGAGMALPILDLDYAGGSHLRENLDPREAAYYRVTVPSNSPNWSFTVTPTAGEVMWAGLRGAVPNIESVGFSRFDQGRSGQKAGPEHFLLLPEGTNSALAGGAYYLAVVGEGAATNSARIGAGSSAFEIRSHGLAALIDLATVGSSPISREDSLQGGATKLYRFAVPPNVSTLELLLENRVGVPAMFLRTDAAVPSSGAAVQTLPQDVYGGEGGAPHHYAATNLITIPSPPPGTYTLAIKARGPSGAPPDARYTLIIRQAGLLELNPDEALNANGLAHTISGSLLDNQRAFFRVQIPSNHLGAPVLGWKLNLANTAGQASVRVRKDALPSDTVSGMPFATNAAVVVPPFLTPGAWFIEVKGAGSNHFVLSSSLLAPRLPAWRMPESFAPGDFGDSGIDATGAPLPNDQGIDLEGGDYHLFAVAVPSNNPGVMRTHLEAIRGAPELFIRADLPPTHSHSTNGLLGSVVERSLTGTAGKIGHWVPLNGRTESALRAGTWYVAVRAAAGPARYRLRVSTTQPQALPLDGGALNNQTLAAGDWAYFRVEVPLRAPESWRISFAEVSGNVTLYLRDTIPPGNGPTGNPDVRDWSADAKNAGPYPNFDPPGTYAIATPPLRPGQTYYLGFRANSAAVFNVSSATGSTLLPDFQSIAFSQGLVTNNLAPLSQSTYRIFAPADAVRWLHRSIHSNVVQYFIEQGTLPLKAASDEFRSAAANSTNTQSLLLGWPWVPNQHYFLTVTNTSTNTQPFSFAMAGIQGPDDDSDNDGLSDRLEILYFGNLNQSGGGDFDNDGVSNANEFAEGTHPADRTSLRPRLITQAANGSVQVDPPGAHYAFGTTVRLTPIPNPGFYFTAWSGHAAGTNTPLALTLISNLTVTANFRLLGDDFDTRFRLTGSSHQVTAVNAAASKETGEPRHANNNGGKSMWWSWIPPVSGPAVISSAGSSFNTLIAVYTGDAVDRLSAPIANSINRPVNLTVIAGTEYQIAIDGFNGASGTVMLLFSVETAPEVPLRLANPVLLANGSVQFTIEGPVGATAAVQTSADLVTWGPAGNVTLTTGSATFTDPDAPRNAKRFYRALRQ